MLPQQVPILILFNELHVNHKNRLNFALLHKIFNFIFNTKFSIPKTTKQLFFFCKNCYHHPEILNNRHYSDAIVLIHSQIPFKEEFIAEMKFILKFEGNTKLVRHGKKSESVDSKHSVASYRTNPSENEVPVNRSEKSFRNK